jgi:hypothetical protein
MRDTINNVLMEVNNIIVLLNGNTNTLKCIYNYIYVLCKTRQYILEPMLKHILLGYFIYIYELRKSCKESSNHKLKQ